MAFGIFERLQPFQEPLQLFHQAQMLGELPKGADLVPQLELQRLGRRLVFAAQLAPDLHRGNRPPRCPRDLVRLFEVDALVGEFEQFAEIAEGDHGQLIEDSLRRDRIAPSALPLGRVNRRGNGRF